MITSVAHYFEHIDPGWTVEPFITKTYVMIFVTEGTLTYLIEGERYVMEKGDLLLIPQGVIRAVPGNDPKYGHDMYLFRFTYDGAAEEALPILLKRTASFVRVSQYEYMKQRFSLVTQHWLRRSNYSTILCRSILIEIIATMNEELDAQLIHSKAYSHVVKLQNYISEYHRRPITVNELAEHIGRTPNYVSTIFHQVTGKRLTEYLQQVRITAAYSMLLESQMSVGEVSDYLGFCEPSYFNKVFKKVTGMQPSTYMNEMTAPEKKGVFIPKK